MSNPTINRWGLNLFWYHFWYYDKNYYLSIQHDFILIKLLHIFLNFGLIFPVNIFISKYWFKKFNLIDYFNNHHLKYFRLVNFKNFISNEMEKYNERVELSNIYQSKIWILKFQHWIILNFYCFNPVKKRQLKDLQINKNFSTDTLITNFKLKLENYKRLRFIFFILMSKQVQKKHYYGF
jgi:hypothetical protein